jgi:hypothetical protein
MQSSPPPSIYGAQHRLHPPVHAWFSPLPVAFANKNLQEFSD